MNSLIHILDVQYYGIAILITCAIGCSNMASHVHSRWFSHRPVNIIRIQWIVKLAIIVWGLLFVKLSSLFGGFLYVQLLSIFPAILLGLFAVKIELFINRMLLHRSKYHKNVASQYIFHHSINNKTLGLSVRSSQNKVNLRNIHEHHARLDSEIKNYRLNDIIVVAICEEIIFRGFIWKLGLQLPMMFLTMIVLALSVILFGASHLTLGKGQFLSKSILGAFCMLSVIVIGSVIPAIVIHIVFNIAAYQAMLQLETIRMRS